MQIALLYPDP